MGNNCLPLLGMPLDFLTIRPNAHRYWSIVDFAKPRASHSTK